MSLTINHNPMAQNAYGNFSKAYGSLGTSIERISSGYRINNASDDAAGLAIREIMRADIATTQQGLRNAADAISMLETADGSLAIIDEKLIRMKELAEQAATATYTTSQRDMINSEYQAMAREIDRIANATEFNGIKLLDGSVSNMNGGQGLDIHFGTGNTDGEDSYFVNLGDARATSTTGLQVGGDAKNDIWGQGGAASGELAGPGCCTAGFTGLNSEAGFTSGDSFSYGYNWDWKEDEDAALDSGKYLAGRYVVGESESLQDLVNKVNKGTQSRVGIEMDAATLQAGVKSGGTVAICVGDESYIFGSAALAKGGGVEGWKSEITSKEFGMIGDAIVSEQEAHRLSAAGYEFKGITGKGESDITGNAGSAAALSDAVADANKKLESGVSVTVAATNGGVEDAGLGTAGDTIKLSDTTDSKGGTVDIENLWIDKHGNFTKDAAVAEAMGFHQAKMELTVSTDDNPLSADNISKAVLKFGTDSIDLTSALGLTGAIAKEFDLTTLAKALDDALTTDGMKGFQFSEGSRAEGKATPAVLAGMTDIASSDFIGTDAYTLAANKEAGASGVAIKGLFMNDAGAWTQDADLAAAEGYKQAYLKMTASADNSANIGSATVHFGDKDLELSVAPLTTTEITAAALITALDIAFKDETKIGTGADAGKEMEYQYAAVATTDFKSTILIADVTGLGAAVDVTLADGKTTEGHKLESLWINEETGAFTTEKKVADADEKFKEATLHFTGDTMIAGATVKFGTGEVTLLGFDETKDKASGAEILTALNTALQHPDTAKNFEQAGKMTSLKEFDYEVAALETTAALTTVLEIPAAVPINDLWINSATGAWTKDAAVAAKDANFSQGEFNYVSTGTGADAEIVTASAKFGNLELTLEGLGAKKDVAAGVLGTAIKDALAKKEGFADDNASRGMKATWGDKKQGAEDVVNSNPWAKPDFDDTDNYTGENKEVKAAALVDNTKMVCGVATAEDSLDKFTTSALASAINNNSASQFWAMTEQVEFTNDDGDQEFKEMLYVFAKVGGNLNSLEACERTSKDDGGKEAGTGVDFENVQSGNFNASGTTFSLGGEKWGHMTPVQTKERDGNQVWNVTLDGRDVGKERDLRIVDNGDLTTPGMDNRSINGMDRDSFLEIQNAADAEFAGAEVRSQSTAQEALVALDAAILNKDTLRADIGAMMNRLENTMTNLTVQSENLMAAESRISDVDIAKEMTTFTKNNTMAQAANSMLAQANSITSMALQLIG